MTVRGYDFTIQENGLQIDQPPEIGNISIVRIIIMKNDNAEGIIEFDPRYTTFEGRFSNLTYKFSTNFWSEYLNMTLSVWIPTCIFLVWGMCVCVCVFTHILCIYLCLYVYIFVFNFKTYFELLLGSLKSHCVWQNEMVRNKAFRKIMFNFRIIEMFIFWRVLWV